MAAKYSRLAVAGEKLVCNCQSFFWLIHGFQMPIRSNSSYVWRIDFFFDFFGYFFPVFSA
jgi:hypothetical protein